MLALVPLKNVRGDFRFSELATNLLIAAFMKSHFKPRVSLNLTQLADFSRHRSFALTNRDPAAQALRCTFRRDAFQLNFVDLSNSIPGGGNQICKLAIISEQ